MLYKGIIWLHKWLGIISGVVVFILSVTGCVYVFQDELKLAVYPERYYIENTESTQEPLAVSVLLNKAQRALGSEQKITRLDLFPDKNRTWIFRAAKTNEQAFGHWNYQEYYKRVFVNPYSGEVQAVENTKYEFFQVVLQLHLNLLLGKKIGHPIVGISTILFTVLLLSGIVLWWPKQWKWYNLKKRLTLSFSVNWKRLIYDLHNVLGFYALWIALLFAITGLAFAYPGFKKSYVSIFNAVDNRTIASNQQEPSTNIFNLDDALSYTLAKHVQADMMSLRLKPSGDKQDIQVRLQKDQTGKFVWYYFNFTDGVLDDLKSSETNRLGDQMGAMNYDLHVGNFGGRGTKILYFLMSLICASLPVSGYLMWMNKSRKKKRRSRSIIRRWAAAKAFTRIK